MGNSICTNAGSTTIEANFAPIKKSQPPQNDQNSPKSNDRKQDLTDNEGSPERKQTLIDMGHVTKM